MPVYQCSFQHGLLTDEMKAKVADAITDAQVEVTGAPRLFVHTFFNELPPGISYSADGPDPKISGQPAKQLIAGLTEIDSEIQMEYGLILPKPGDEPQWFADNADALDGISGTGL